MTSNDIRTTFLFLIVFFHSLKENYYANHVIHENNQDQPLRNILLGLNRIINYRIKI